MKLFLTLVTLIAVVKCTDLFVQYNETSSMDIDTLLENAGYPKPGDIPVLNRKIFKGRKVWIQEHPYVVSIRRRIAHYLVGTLLTRNIVVTVAHPLANVPITELGVVLGETYCDRGTTIATVVFIVIHHDFDPYTLNADIAMLRIYENTSYKFTVKSIQLVSFKTNLEGRTASVAGWGRCDNTGMELCLYRSSLYYPDERVDPILQSVSFTVSLSNDYCIGYKRHDVLILEGMLCMGPSREEDPVCPCMGVPGAPLVVESRLVGLLSWGFGCGYGHDLPLIYTSINIHSSWILHNIVASGRIKRANLTQLFQATKAYIIAEWFIQTRVITPSLKIKRDKSLKPLEIDKALADLEGKVVDVRDFINGGSYHKEKQNIYSELTMAHRNKADKLLLKNNQERVSLHAFLSKNTADVDFKWLPFKDTSDQEYLKNQLLSDNEKLDENKLDISDISEQDV